MASWNSRAPHAFANVGGKTVVSQSDTSGKRFVTKTKSWSLWRTMLIARMLSLTSFCQLQLPSARTRHAMSRLNVLKSGKRDMSRKSATLSVTIAAATLMSLSGAFAADYSGADDVDVEVNLEVDVGIDMDGLHYSNKIDAHVDGDS